MRNVTSRHASQVLPNLWIGGYYTASDEGELASLGVTHVCSLVDVVPQFAKLSYCIHPLEDGVATDPRPVFDSTNAFIQHALMNGGTVIVVCGSGISRAPTIVAAFLIFQWQRVSMSAQQAVDIIRKCRPCIRPNAGFKTYLEKYQSMLLGTTNPTP
jgi:hypothetical protein